MAPIDDTPTSVEFYRARGEVFSHGLRTLVELPCRCRHLSGTGRCKTYATRPVACVRFEVGSAMCVFAVSRRRPDQAEAILALMP